MKLWQTGNQKNDISATCRRRMGFSLVEVLVVVAIIFLLLGLMVGIGTGVQKFKARSKTELLLNSACSAASKVELSYGHPLDHMEAQCYRVVNASAGIDRAMTPTEYFVFKCSFASDAYRQLQGTSELLVNSTIVAGRPTATPSTTVTAAKPLMVKVIFIHQDKANPAGPWLQDVVVDYAPPTSPGYPLATLIDGWGHEIEYRTSRQNTYWDSNNDDILDAPNEPFVPGTWASYQGFVGWPGWVGAGWTSAAGVTSSGFDVRYGTTVDPVANLANPVNPAMPNYNYAYFVSAGPDGLWGTLAGHQSAQPNSAAQDNLYSNAPNAN